MEWKNISLRSLWKTGKEKLLVFFCAGLLLFLLTLPEESKEKETAQAVWETDQSTDHGYETELEQRIRSILEGVEGVGRVDVMVGTAMPQDAGYVSWDQERYPVVTGVVISADGGESQVVQTEISQAMEALFGIPSHKIKVLKRVKEGV